MANKTNKRKKYKVNHDGIYSTIIECHPEDNEGKSFREAKKELREYTKEQLEDWKYAHSAALKMKECDARPYTSYNE